MTEAVVLFSFTEDSYVPPPNWKGVQAKGQVWESNGLGGMGAPGRSPSPMEVVGSRHWDFSSQKCPLGKTGSNPSGSEGKH